MRPNLITRLKEEWNNLDPVDPLRGLIADAIDALAEKPANQLDDINVVDIPKIGCVNHDCDKCKAQQQESVGKWMGDCVEWTENPYKFRKGQPIYTSPQPSKPLTGVLSIAYSGGRVVTCSFKTEAEAKAFEQYAIEVAHQIGVNK